MSSNTELSRKMKALENQMEKILKPVPIFSRGFPCTHTEVDGVCPHGCLSPDDVKSFIELFDSRPLVFTFGRGSSSEFQKGQGRIKVTCVQGRQKFTALRKGDYFVKSSEEGEEFWAKIPE